MSFRATRPSIKRSRYLCAGVWGRSEGQLHSADRQKTSHVQYHPRVAAAAAAPVRARRRGPALPAPEALAQRASAGPRPQRGPRSGARSARAGPFGEDAAQEARQQLRPQLHVHPPAHAAERQRAAGVAAPAHVRRPQEAEPDGDALRQARQGGQEGAAEVPAVAVDVHALSGAVHLEGPGRAFLAALHQGGQLFQRALLLLPRGHVMQAGQVGDQDPPAVVLPGLPAAEVLHVDIGAVPHHLRVQVLLLSRERGGLSIGNDCTVYPRIETCGAT